MPFRSISCYRLLGNQRIDGRLTLRTDSLHFEADFPSKHRLYLPLHKMLGFHHETDPVPMLRTLSEFGTVAFYPIQENLNESSACGEEFTRQVQTQFKPSETPWLTLTEHSIDEVDNANQNGEGKAE